MRQRSGRSAGEQVAARARRLSSDLLVEETRCFREIERLFGMAVPVLSGWVVRTPALAMTGRELQARVQGLLAGCIEGSIGPVEVLLQRSGELAVESVLDELRLIEEAWPARYRGSADAALPLVTARMPRFVSAGVEQYRGDLPEVLSFGVQDVTQQALLWSQTQETKDLLVQRIVSLEPNRLPGCSGKGVWWRSASWLELMARSVSIEVTNSLRSLAMGQMNEAMGGR